MISIGTIRGVSVDGLLIDSFENSHLIALQSGEFLLCWNLLTSLLTTGKISFVLYTNDNTTLPIQPHLHTPPPQIAHQHVISFDVIILNKKTASNRCSTSWCCSQLEIASENCLRFAKRRVNYFSFQLVWNMFLDVSQGSLNLSNWRPVCVIVECPP